MQNGKIPQNYSAQKFIITVLFLLLLFFFLFLPRDASAERGYEIAFVCWFASASFSGPLLSVSVDFYMYVCMCVRNFEVKYLGNQRS